MNKYTYFGIAKFFKYFTIKIPHWIYKNHFTILSVLYDQYGRRQVYGSKNADIMHKNSNAFKKGKSSSWPTNP